MLPAQRKQIVSALVLLVLLECVYPGEAMDWRDKFRGYAGPKRKKHQVPPIYKREGFLKITVPIASVSIFLLMCLLCCTGRHGSWCCGLFDVNPQYIPDLTDLESGSATELSDSPNTSAEAIENTSPSTIQVESSPEENGNQETSNRNNEVAIDTIEVINEIQGRNSSDITSEISLSSANIDTDSKRIDSFSALQPPQIPRSDTSVNVVEEPSIMSTQSHSSIASENVPATTNTDSDVVIDMSAMIEDNMIDVKSSDSANTEDEVTQNTSVKTYVSDVANQEVPSTSKISPQAHSTISTQPRQAASINEDTSINGSQVSLLQTTEQHKQDRMPSKTVPLNTGVNRNKAGPRTYQSNIASGAMSSDSKQTIISESQSSINTSISSRGNQIKRAIHGLDTSEHYLQENNSNKVTRSSLGQQQIITPSARDSNSTISSLCEEEQAVAVCDSVRSEHSRTATVPHTSRQSEERVSTNRPGSSSNIVTQSGHNVPQNKDTIDCSRVSSDEAIEHNKYDGSSAKIMFSNDELREKTASRKQSRSAAVKPSQQNIATSSPLIRPDTSVSVSKTDSKSKYQGKLTPDKTRDINASSFLDHSDSILRIIPESSSSILSLHEERKPATVLHSVKHKHSRTPMNTRESDVGLITQHTSSSMNSIPQLTHAAVEDMDESLRSRVSYNGTTEQVQYERVPSKVLSSITGISQKEKSEQRTSNAQRQSVQASERYKAEKTSLRGQVDCTSIGENKRKKTSLKQPRETQGHDAQSSLEPSDANEPMIHAPIVFVDRKSTAVCDAEKVKHNIPIRQQSQLKSARLEAKSSIDRPKNERLIKDVNSSRDKGSEVPAMTESDRYGSEASHKVRKPDDYIREKTNRRTRTKCSKTTASNARQSAKIEEETTKIVNDGNSSPSLQEKHKSKSTKSALLKDDDIPASVENSRSTKRAEFRTQGTQTNIRSHRPTQEYNKNENASIEPTQKQATTIDSHQHQTESNHITSQQIYEQALQRLGQRLAQLNPVDIEVTDESSIKEVSQKAAFNLLEHIKERCPGNYDVSSETPAANTNPISRWLRRSENSGDDNRTIFQKLFHRK